MHSKKRRMRIRQKQKRRAKRELVVHGLTGRGGRGDPFFDLEIIVKHGFKINWAGIGPNVIRWKKYLKIYKPKDRSKISSYSRPSSEPQTLGDRYAILMKARVKDKEVVDGTLPYAFPNQIKKIYIKIDHQLKTEQRQKRIEFYKKQFPRIELVFEK